MILFFLYEKNAYKQLVLPTTLNHNEHSIDNRLKRIYMFMYLFTDEQIHKHLYIAHTHTHTSGR